MVTVCAGALMLSACAQTPFGPTVQVVPGPGKPFDAFASDQAVCKSYASDQVKGQAEASNQRAAGTAALTTLIGAGLGAAIGGATGNAGAGAAIGATAGAAGGGGVGAANNQNDQGLIQAQYDNAFAQCMYSKGNQVAGFPAPVAANQGPAAQTGPDPALVASIQNELIRLGYLEGPADGSYGPHTRAAIRQYQQSAGLATDGAISHRLLGRLEATTAGPSPTAAEASRSASPNWVSPAAASGQAAAPAGWVSPGTTQ